MQNTEIEISSGVCPAFAKASAGRRGKLVPSFSVKSLMNFSEMFIRDVRVDLRRRDIGVTKECLHASQIGTIFEKVGRK